MSKPLKTLIEEGLASPDYNDEMVNQIMHHIDYSPLAVTTAICEATNIEGNQLDEELFSLMAEDPRLTIQQAMEVSEYTKGLTQQREPENWWEGGKNDGLPYYVIGRLFERLSPEEQRQLITEQINKLVDNKPGMGWRVARFFSYATPSENGSAKTLIDFFTELEESVTKSEWQALLDAVTVLEAT